MQIAEFQAAKTFIRKLYSNFPISEDAAHVGFVIYGKEPHVVFDLIEHEDKQNVDSKLLTATSPISDGNFLGQGLMTAKRSVFDVSARPGGHQVLVILAAGKSKDDTTVPSRTLRDNGVTIFGIGIGNKVDVNQLRDIVSAPEENNLAITNLEDLENLLSPTVQNIRKGELK